MLSKKNLILYAFIVILCILGIIYFAIPKSENTIQTKQPQQQLNKNNQEIKKVANNNVTEKKIERQISKLDSQNYEFLNDKIVTLTKQVEILKKNNTNDIKKEFEKLYAELDKLKISNEQLVLENNELKDGKSKKSYEKQIEELSDEIKKYKQDIDGLNLNLNEKENTINNLNLEISKLNKKELDIAEYDKNIKKLQSDLDNEKNKAKENQNALSDITKENLELKNKVEKLSQLDKNNDKINALSLENQNLTSQINEANALIDELKKSNSDLNTKINSFDNFEKERDELKNTIFMTKLELEKYKSKEKEYNTKNEQESENINEKNQNLLSQLKEKDEKISTIVMENESLKKQIDSIKQEQNIKQSQISDSKETSNEMISLKSYNELNEKFNNLQNELTNKDLENQKNKQEILSLENKIKILNENLNSSSDNNTKVATNVELNTKNLQLKDTFTCDDIKIGTSKISSTCALELDKFLSKYNENYLYEITPIIDNSGFKSLSVIDGIHMDSNEVKRLTRLANFGLSKDRTKSAAEYIKSKVPNALISSSLEPEYSKDNKKGFILRVYK